MANKLPSTYVSDFLDFVAKAQVLYRICNEEMSSQEKLTQDYLHSLELDELDRGERSKIATKLSTNRKDRRYYKDRVEEFEPIVEFFKDPNHKKTLDQLTQILGKLRKAEDYHKNRTYKPKVLREELK